MNNLVAAVSVAVISGTFFLATAPQREVARRELERQDALIEKEEASLKALSEEQIKRANELIEQSRAASSP